MPDEVEEREPSAIVAALFPPDTDPAVIAARLREIADEQSG
jgi:hypothetical protein